MKTVLITGASSGIGEALADQLSGKAELVVMARRRDALAEVARRTGAAMVVGDVTDATACALAAQALVGDDLVLVNCAGIATFVNVQDADFERMAAQVEVNLIGLMRMTHAVLPKMIGNGLGEIVNILSVASIKTFDGASAYCASKAGALAFTRTLAGEVRRQGVRVTALMPGAVDTKIWDGGSHQPAIEDMMTPKAVAEVIEQVIFSPRDRSWDEILLMPPKGIV